MAFPPTQAEIDDESRRIRRLRIVVQLTLDTIADGDLPLEEAAQMVAATRNIALEMFPGKEGAFDLLYRPKFQRVMHAVYRLQYFFRASVAEVRTNPHPHENRSEREDRPDQRLVFAVAFVLIE